MSTENIVKLPIDWLKAGKYQPRTVFDEYKLNELAETIKTKGLILPIVVRPISEKKYEIIAGERRWRAAMKAGLQEVPVVIRNYNDKDALEASLIENLIREQLNPIDEAEAIIRLIEEFKITQEAAAKRIGKERSEITNKIRLLELEHRVKALIRKGKLNATHGRVLGVLPLEKQYYYAEKTIAKNWSTRTLEKMINSYELGIKKPRSVLNKAKDIDTQRLEQNLSDHFSQKVEIEFSQTKKGSLIIHFNDFDELNGILEKAGYRSD